jgi:hypothetical protein
MPGDTTLKLILTEQQRIGGAVATLADAIHAHNVENAKFPEKVRLIIQEEIPKCPAYQYFHRRGDGDRLDETTHEVDTHGQLIESLKEKIQDQQAEIDRMRRKISINPNGSKSPWWAPSLVKATIALVGALGATGLGAWGVHCSSAKTEGTDTARGAQPPVASNNK